MYLIISLFIYICLFFFSGGITLTVLGRGLDISESPILEVSTVTSLLVNSIVQTNRVSYQSVGATGEHLLSGTIPHRAALLCTALPHCIVMENSAAPW